MDLPRGPSYVVADKENDESLATGRSIHGLRSPFKPTMGRYATNSPSLNNSNLYVISGREEAEKYWKDYLEKLNGLWKDQVQSIFISSVYKDLSLIQLFFQTPGS